jgi:hypothetical protein
MERPEIILGGGSRSWKVKAPPAILLALPGVEIVDDLAFEPPPLEPPPDGTPSPPS